MEEQDYDYDDLFGPDQPLQPPPAKFTMPSSTPMAKPYPNLAPESTQYKKNNFVPKKRKLQRVVSAEENTPALKWYLKQYWGHDDFRGQQKDICEAVVKGDDVLVVAPTGLGKSVCFQVPAIALSGITIVVSPIIALMKDQLQSLKSKNISAAMLSSKSTPEELREITRQLKMGYPTLKLLYVTPERMSNGRFRSDLMNCYERKHLMRLVIDEAHVIEEWGLTFRKEYRKLGDFRRDFPDTPITALTASATEQVRGDICDLLGMKKWAQFVDPTNRVNLFYEIRHGSRGFTPDWKATNIADFILSWRPEAMARMENVGINVPCVTGLVYCRYRSSCDEVVEVLKKKGIKARSYYATLKDEELTEAINDWKEGRIECIVATIAFGMGVDQPNVRYVVHYDMPKSFEGYYQETGRAGRDGHLSRCLMYYSREDAQSVRNSVQSDANKAAAQENAANGLEEADVSNAKRRCVDSFKLLWQYAEDVSTCRHVLICRYFGEIINDSDQAIKNAYCNQMCDVCVNPGAVSRGRTIVNENIPTPSQVIPWAPPLPAATQPSSSPPQNSLDEHYPSSLRSRGSLVIPSSALRGSIETARGSGKRKQRDVEGDSSAVEKRREKSFDGSSPIVNTGRTTRRSILQQLSTPNRAHTPTSASDSSALRLHPKTSHLMAPPPLNTFTTPGPSRGSIPLDPTPNPSKTRKQARTQEDITGSEGSFALPTAPPQDPQRRDEHEEKQQKQREDFEKVEPVLEDFAPYYANSAPRMGRKGLKNVFKTPFKAQKTIACPLAHIATQNTSAPTRKRANSNVSLPSTIDPEEARRVALSKIQDKLLKSLSEGELGERLWVHWRRVEVGESKVKAVKKVGRNLESLIAEESLDQKGYQQRVTRTIKVMRLFKDPLGVQSVVEGTFGQATGDKPYVGALRDLERLMRA